MKRLAAENRGRRGEAIAAWFPCLKGWRFVVGPETTLRGEVDLIARGGKSIVFVEVKARTHTPDLATAIDTIRIRRVAVAAEILPCYGKECENIQIDVIMVAPWRCPNHLLHFWHG